MTRLFHSARNGSQRAIRALLLVACVFVMSPAAQAEDAEEKSKRSQIISRTTMSPFCPGRTLESCPSPYATEWREDIRKMVDQGMGTDEIRAALEQRLDKDLSGSPSTMLDGVLPALVTLVALLLLIFLLRAMVRSRREEIRQMPESKKGADEVDAKTAAKTSDEQLDARLREELDNMEGDSLDDR